MGSDDDGEDPRSRSGRESVRPGDLILAKSTSPWGHDLTIPPAARSWREQMGAEKIWDRSRWL